MDISKWLNKTNGKKTTATAVIYVALKLVRMKYPDFLDGQDALVETVFSLTFGSALAHKWLRNGLDKYRKYRAKKRLTK